MPTVEVPGIGDVHFPDGMSNVEMEGAVKKLLVEKQSGRFDPSQISSGTLSRESVQGAMAQKNNSMAQDVAHAQETGDSLMARGRQMAVQDATKTSGTLAKNILVPAAEAGIGLATGGLSLPAQGLIGAGTELAAQKTGLKPESTTQLVLGALGPGLGALASKLFRAGTLALGRATTPTETVSQIGKEAAAQRLGTKADVLERAAAPKASDELYRQARSAGQVETGGLGATIEEALDREMRRATPDRATVNRLKNLKKKFDANPELPSDEVVDELQDLSKATSQAFKQKQSVRGTHLSEATHKAKSAAGEQIDTLAAADKAYSREQATKSVLKAMGKDNPVKALDDLLEKDGETMLQVMSKEELQDIRDIAGRMGRSVSSEGFLNRIHESGKQMLSEMLGSQAGRSLLRKVMGPENKMTGAKIGAAFTFWRAYKAYEENQ